MAKLLSRIVLACFLALFPAYVATASGDDHEAERLIDQLVDVAEAGFGYSAFVSGNEFLPYQDTGEISTLILGADQPARSDVLRKLVEQGADAVPMLLKHIGDNRPCKMKPVSGMMWMEFRDEYDFNRRTAQQRPDGVNRRRSPANDDQPSEHAVTVGDLCFVALGQIVNRRFSATRYQPSGGMIVNSPGHSQALRKAISAEWSGLTRDEHKRRLVEDFVNSDHEDRRNGAYLRLAFYYPEAVETLVLDELAKPTFDVFAIFTFCREVLYKTVEKDERQRKYEEFLREHGKVAAAGVMDQLLGDLSDLEAQEQGAISPPLTEFSTQPRELLVQLFGQPANVRSRDRPLVAAASASERARLIRTLTHDRSTKIADAVKQVFLDSANDDYLAEACLRCLANRKQEAFLIEQLGRAERGGPDQSKLYLAYLKAIATSKDEAVRAKLWEFAQKTTSDEYFMAALPAIDRKHDPTVLEVSQKLLAMMPADTKQGEALLKMIGERFPDEAPTIYRSFLSTDSAQRIDTVCRVLWYGNPLSKRILARYLDDKRELSGFTIRLRVCDRAAQAISHATDHLKFDSDWSVAERDAQIERLKDYCLER